MSFFSIFLALVLEQARPLAAENPVYRAMEAWTGWVARTLDAGVQHLAWVTWGTATLSPAVLALLVHALAKWGLGWLAAVLWNGGASFGGVIAFIFADLIILPILDIYRRYYGLKVAALLTDDLVAGGERDEMREAFQRDAVPVTDVARDRLAHLVADPCRVHRTGLGADQRLDQRSAVQRLRPGAQGHRPAGVLARSGGFDTPCCCPREWDSSPPTARGVRG